MARLCVTPYRRRQETDGRQPAPPEEHCSQEERLLLQLPAVNALSAPLLLSRCGPLRQLRGYPLSQLVQQLPELPVRVLAQLQRDLQLQQQQQLQQNTPGDRYEDDRSLSEMPLAGLRILTPVGNAGIVRVAELWLAPGWEFCCKHVDLFPLFIIIIIISSFFRTLKPFPEVDAFSCCAGDQW